MMFALEYTPYIVPFVLSLLIALGLGIYAYRFRHVRAATTFALLMLGLSVWALCYTLELSGVTLEAKTFWASAKYIGSATVPVLFFLLSFRLTRNERWLTPPVQFALWAFAFVTVFVVFTNEFHQWYWTDLELVAGSPAMQVTFGSFFWIYAGVSYLFVLTSAVLYSNHYRATPVLYRRQALWMGVAGFVPLVGRILEDFLNIELVPNVDNGVLFFTLSGGCLAVAIFRYGALDIARVAHRVVFENISAGIMVLDASEQIIALNPYAQALVSENVGTTIGKPLQTVLADFPDMGIKVRGEREVSVGKNDNPRWFQISSTPILGDNAALAGYSVVLQDITQRKRAEQQLEALARTDALTGIINRRYFYDLAEVEFARARRYDRQLSLMIIDVDHFKRINDAYGHSVGDRALEFIATKCKQHFRATDIFARYGGEKFVCLLEEIEIEDARRSAERIRHDISSSPIPIEDKTLHVTISIGLACLDADGPLFLSELLRRAEQALYRAKADGRDMVRVWRVDYVND